jgi:hypothetical protein
LLSFGRWWITSCLIEAVGENALSKNLTKLDKLLKVTNDASLTDGIVKFVKENTGNVVKSAVK